MLAESALLQMSLLKGINGSGRIGRELTSTRLDD